MRDEPTRVSSSETDILLVDDHPSNLLALEAMLTEVGETIVKATSGTEALKCLLRQDFAVILLDVQMPDMDGFETAALIRGRERSRHTPIIFLTAFDTSDIQVYKGYSLGAVDFLFKPIVPEILKSKVLVFIELHRRAEEIRRQGELLREAERRESEQKLSEARQRWETDLLRREMEREKRIARTLIQKAEELGQTILERQRAEEALLLSNDRLRLLSETASRLLLEPNPGAFIKGLFARLCDHLGLELYFHHVAQADGEMVLESFAGMDEASARGDDWEALTQSITTAVAVGRQRLTEENIQLSSKLETAMMRALGLSSLVCFPLLAYQKLIGTLLLGTRRRASLSPEELALVQTICDQVAMVLERERLTTELKKRADELVEADRRKDEFLAMLAHELRNPLAPIRNGLEVLLKLAGGNPQVMKAWDAMERQVWLLTRLVDDLLDVARITHGRIELRPESVEVRTVVEQAINLCMPLLNERRVQPHVQLPVEALRVEVDPARLSQVIANLVNNATKYNEPDGAVWISVTHNAHELCIRVKDNGIGIDPEMLPRVFELFVQADQSLDRARGGLGIGLTLARRIIEMHGGRVEAFSEGLGRGSEFVIRFPLEAVELRAEKTPDSAREETGSQVLEARDELDPEPLKILIIEDNRDIRESMTDLLQLYGHQVEAAAEGVQGLQLVQELRPDVAVIDIGLPGVDGYRVAEQIRARMSASQIRLIALTGYGRPADRQRALEAGFDAYLVKPVAIDTLFRLLSEQREELAPGRIESWPVSSISR